MLEDKLLELIEMVQSAAPEIWRIALARAWASVYAEVWWFSISLIVTIISLIGYIRGMSENRYSDPIGWAIIGVIFFVMTWVLGGCLISHLGSIEYMAIQSLKTLVMP